MNAFFETLFLSDDYKDDDDIIKQERIDLFKSSYQKCTQLSSKYDI
jgi:hypothetical protein